MKYHNYELNYVFNGLYDRIKGWEVIWWFDEDCGVIKQHRVLYPMFAKMLSFSANFC